MTARLLLARPRQLCHQVNPEDVETLMSAKAKAEAVQTALVKGDFATVADHTHPRIIEGMGGREVMLAALTVGFEAMRVGGITIERVTVLDPSAPVRVGTDTYVHVPFDLEMTGTGCRLRDRGGLIGFSPDGGKTWTFVDTSPGRAEIKRLIPELPDAIDIPAKGRPKVMED